MAKLCSPYGSSPPVSSIFSDLTPNSFNTDEYYISADPFDFLEDLPSIYGDIQKIESDMINGDCDTPYDCGAMDLDDIDMKPELRNTDLMWSAPASSILSTSASSMSSDISTAVPLSAVMGSSSSSIQIKTEKSLSSVQQTQQQQQNPPPTVVVAKKLSHHHNTMDAVKQEPDVEQHLEHHSIPNSKMATVTAAATMQNLPPGTSLLRKSATQQQQQQQQQPKKLQQIRGTLHITKRGDQLLPSVANSSSPFIGGPNSSNSSANTSSSSIASSVSSCSSPTSSNTSSSSQLNTSSSSSNSSFYQRPDTPHSLDDDCSTPEFRHNVDLRACVMGSNNISLTSDPTNFINHVSQELQDLTKKQIDTRLISGCSLADVLDVINANATDSANTSTSTSATATAASSSTSGSSSAYSDCLSFNTSGGGGGSGGGNSSEFDSDEESTAGSSTSSLLDHDITYGAGGVSPVSSQSSNISTHHYMKHSDHSYTRCKDGMDDMMGTNLETPSDSEEEIDVVSINDKKLPTNPSDKDRRALQTKVAHKFNAARIVKTPNGIRTIPPRRRGSYEFPYTPASNSPVKSVNNSRFPSPAATPYQSQYTTKYVQQQQQQMASVVVTDSATGTPINILSTDKSRKRLLAQAAGGAAALPAGTVINGEIVGSSGGNGINGNSSTLLPPTKKHRGKKPKHVVAAVHLANSHLLKRHYNVDETADTIEKRNLHNDLERQRRIGLKNLFEALKKQIPSIKDKERAPKVNILREAAKFCEALTREDQQLAEQRIKLKEELRRKQELLNQLRQQQRV